MTAMPDSHRRRVYLHIGTHKTGTTSAQSFLGSHREELAKNGIIFYQGKFSIDPNNHVDIARACLDLDKEFFGDSNKKLRRGKKLFELIEKDILIFLNQIQDKKIIFSSEDISLLRSASEFDRLSRLIDPKRNEIIVVLVTRNTEDFLNSYRQQIFKVPGRRPSDDPRSALYVSRDTWLTNYESIVDGFVQFGAAEIRRLDYDCVMAAEGDMLPALLRALDLPEALIPAPGAVKWCNSTPRPPPLHRQIARKLDTRKNPAI